jgi:hypothetical protein
MGSPEFRLSQRPEVVSLRGTKSTASSESFLFVLNLLRLDWPVALHAYYL